MTSISGYQVLSAPCCGARYTRPTYLSINLCEWRRWSDGFAYGALYWPSPQVCFCSCGAFFLASMANRIARIGLESKEAEIPPRLPWLTSEQAYQAIEEGKLFTDRRIECEVRLQYWRILNHRYRKASDGSGNDYAEVGPTPWSALTDAEADARIDANLEQLTPLIEEFHENDKILNGEIYRARGLMDQAVANYSLEHEEDADVVRYLIGLANVGARRVVRIESPSW